MFAFMPTSVRRGFVGLSRPNKSLHGDAVTNSMSSMSLTSKMGKGIHPYTILALNLITQLVCVSGVNQLSSVSHPSPVTFAHTRIQAPVLSPHTSVAPFPASLSFFFTFPFSLSLPSHVFPVPVRDIMLYPSKTTDLPVFKPSSPFVLH